MKYSVFFLQMASLALVLMVAGCGGGSGTPSVTSPSTSVGTSSTQLTYPIVDTAQTRFYANSGELATAPATLGNAFYGQDAQFSGRQPAYRNNGDGTITDMNTGLMWVKARGGKVSWADAKAGVASATVGGYSDWRVPTIKELYSLINFTGNLGNTDASSVPYIDTSYFDIAFGDTNPNASSSTVGNRVIDAQDWSVTAYVSTTMQGDLTAFGVNFIDGRIKGYPLYDAATLAANTKYVRYVRGNADYGKNKLVANGDGTVIDNATGLIWAQDDSHAGMNWQDALAWVQLQNAGNYLGHNDWRLPNAKELQSIVDYTRSPATTGTAAIDPLFLSSAISNEGGVTDFPYYWAGTTHVENGASNEAIYLSFGRALGWMKFGANSYYTLVDAHGAGAQRSDPKTGNAGDYPLGKDVGGNAIYGRGPQGDVVRIKNFVRLVRGPV